MCHTSRLSNRNTLGRFKEGCKVIDAAKNRRFIDVVGHEMDGAAKAWRALGVSYSLRDAGEPKPPEKLLLTTAWLFAYDFHFASLVGAWVKYRGDVLDLSKLISVIRGMNSWSAQSET